MRTILGRNRPPRPLSRFPSGRAGVGLLLLRVLIGLSALFQGWADLQSETTLASFSSILGLLTASCGMLLLAGFLTPALCAIFSMEMLAAAAGLLPAPPQNLYGRTVPALYLVVVSTAVALLGPGAISLDARLFGIREIVVSRKHEDSNP